MERLKLCYLPEIWKTWFRMKNNKYKPKMKCLKGYFFIKKPLVGCCAHSSLRARHLQWFHVCKQRCSLWNILSDIHRPGSISFQHHVSFLPLGPPEILSSVGHPAPFSSHPCFLSGEIPSALNFISHWPWGVKVSHLGTCLAKVLF